MLRPYGADDRLYRALDVAPGSSPETILSGYEQAITKVCSWLQSSCTTLLVPAHYLAQGSAFAVVCAISKRLHD